MMEKKGLFARERYRVLERRWNDELEALRKENKKLKGERDFFKKMMMRTDVGKLEARVKELEQEKRYDNCPVCRGRPTTNDCRECGKPGED